jgi:protein SCO1/2
MRPLVLALLLLLPGAAAAQTGDGFAWRQHPGRQLDVGAQLTDSSGHRTTLGALLGTAPAILDVGYFHCPSLCGVVRSDVFAALGAGGIHLGPDASLIALSLDASETPADAAQARASDLARFPAANPAGVQYVTASASVIQAVEDAIGLRVRWDPALKQFLHPAGIVVLTRTGQISAYLLGVGYTGGDLRAAVLRAGDGGIAQAALPILLLCFHFDSTTGRYTLAVEKLLRLLAGLTVITVAGLVAALAWGRRTKRA